jgi:large subunit ribosomal protein L3
MGGVNRTTQNLLVHRIDTDLNLVYVRGGVPGPDDQYIELTDAVRKVRESVARRFRKGKEPAEWLSGGVQSLPTPGVTLTDVKSNDWPSVVEWPGKGKNPKVRG